MARTFKKRSNDVARFNGVHTENDRCEECGAKLEPQELSIGVCSECLNSGINGPDDDLSDRKFIDEYLYSCNYGDDDYDYEEIPEKDVV